MKLVPVILSACLFSTFTAAALAAIPQPLTPSGPIANVSPTFKWTDTGADQFTVEITKDEVQQTKYVVSAPKMPYPGKLGVGVYSWRVKEGNIAFVSPWSVPLAFTVPPYKPKPTSPVNMRYPAVPTAPVFNWSFADPDANRFTIQLYQDGSLVGATNVNITKDKTFGMVATWPAALPAGTYEWRIRATRKSSNSALTLSSPWSEFNTFSVGVPLPCVIMKPDANSSRFPGSSALTILWTPASGATMYNVKILQNGSLFTSYASFTTNGSKVQAWTPGRYSIIVTPMNPFGDGKPSAPRNFVVNRHMTPGGETILDTVTNRLNWTRSANCSRYRVRLYRANTTNGDYDLLKEDSIDQTLEQPFWKPGGGLLSSVGAYKWQVTDFKNDKALYTSFAYFSIGVPGRPAPTSPAVKKISGLTGLQFTWKPFSGSSTHYQIQVWRNGVLVKDSGWKTPAAFIKGISCSMTYNLTAAGPGAYMWRVREKNTLGSSGWNQRTHKIAALAKPVITSPSKDTSLPVGSSVAIQWTRVAGATHYQVQCWQNGNKLEDFMQSANDVSYQTYDWHVRLGEVGFRIRSGETGWSDWSAPRTITGL